MSITLTVNGERREFAEALSLPALLAEFSIPIATVVVELNGSIVPRASLAEQQLADGDSLEIVTIVGGG